MRLREILKNAPDNADGLFYCADGFSYFYAKSDNCICNFIKKVEYAPNNPSEKCWLAYKENGKWIICINRFTEAEKKLVSLGYEWDEKKGWIKNG